MKKIKKMFRVNAGFMTHDGQLFPEEVGNKIDIGVWMEEKKARKIFEAIKLEDFAPSIIELTNYMLGGLRPYAVLSYYEFSVKDINSGKYLDEICNYAWEDEQEKFIEYSDEIKLFAWSFEHRAKLEKMHKDFLKANKGSEVDFNYFVDYMYRNEKETLNQELN